MEQIILYLAVFTSGSSAIGTIFLVYNHFRNPDIKASTRLDIIESSCPIKHQRIDEIFKEIQSSIQATNVIFGDFRKNDFRHIEDNSKDINVRMATLSVQMDIVISLMKDVLKKN
jgi:hypothetical protein